MFKRTLTGITIFGTLALAPPVLAQGTACAPRDAVVSRLATKYGEVLAAGGLRNAGQLVEIWAAPDTGHWTALVTTPEGISCILAAGTDWHQEKRLEVVKDIPS